MIEFIKSVFKPGDQIRLSGCEGTYEGKIEHIGRDFIVLKCGNGALQGIHISAVQSFSTIDAPSPFFHRAWASYINPIALPVSSEQQSKTMPPESVSASSAASPTHVEGTASSVAQQPTKVVEVVKREVKSAFKPGDKIPLDKLQQIDPSLSKQWKKNDKWWKKNDQRDKAREANVAEQIEQVRQCADEIVAAHGEDLKVKLPAQGNIVEFQPGFNFAFIDDFKSGQRFFFNKQDIVDERILEMSGQYIPVVFTRSRNTKGNAAKCVHLEITAEELIRMSAKIYSTGDTYRAQQMLHNALYLLDKNASIQKLYDLMDQIKRDNEAVDEESETKEPTTHYSYKDNSGYGSAPNRDYATKEREVKKDDAIEMAKAAKLNKDFEQSISLYTDALERGVAVELTIKEIMQLYTCLHNQEFDPLRKQQIKDEAIAFIQKYRRKLPENKSSLGVLENVLFAFGLYQDHVDVAEELIRLAGEDGDTSKTLFYLNKVAMSYQHLNNLELAEDACRQGLEIEPSNPILLRTFQSIVQDPNYESHQEA